MNYRDDLVNLISVGVGLAEVMRHFEQRYSFSYADVHDLMRVCHVEFVLLRAVEFYEISPERRRQLQELSLRE